MVKIIKTTKILLLILGFFFVGAAFVNADDGSGSVTVTVMPQTPVINTVSPGACGNSTLTVSWSDSQNAKSYQLYRDGISINGAAVSPLVDSGLALGSTHSYTITATNTDGTSGLSSAVSGTVANYCPQTLTITNSGPGTISGTYSAPGTYAVNYGSSPVITASAVAGYSVAISNGCTANGAVGFGASCTISNMTSAKTVAVTYTANGCASPCGNLSSGGTCTAYLVASINYPGSCTSQTRTCSAGTLSGSYTNASCTVTSVLPTVTTTSPITSITQTTAIGGGTINSNGGSTVTVSGIVWSTSANPTTANSKTTDGWASGGPWTSTAMTGLTPNTTYHVRAYATNSVGTAYGVDVTFTTSFSPITGLCGVSHYSCSAGTSVSNLNNTSNWTWGCNGAYGGSNDSCSETKTFTINATSGSNGSITPSGIVTKNYGTSQTYTITASVGYFIASVLVDGVSVGAVGSYTFSNISTNHTISATFAVVTVSVVASPTSYNTIPNTNVSILYTPTTNIGSTECRLLNFDESLEIKPYQANSPISVTPPVGPGAYGYHVQCRNKVYTTVTATSALVTVTVFTVTSTASPVTYNVVPGASVNFTYTSTSNPSGATECLLLDSLLAPVSVYKLASPITYNVPNSIGSYGYYIKCRNTITTTAMATSAKITVNTACGFGTSWNGTACVAPSGSISVSNCEITSGGDSCPVTINWNITNPVGPTSVTTPTNIDVVSPTLLLSGTKNYTIGYGSRNFFLYNNSNQIGSTATATATCIDGTVWNGSICEPTTGTLTATGCLISAGNNSCSSDINWETINPLNGLNSEVRTPNISGAVIATSSNIGSGNIGSTTYSIPYGGTTFVLVHNSVSIASASPVATCVSKTTWKNGICELNPPKVELLNISPNPVFKGGSATISWTSDSELVDSCTVTGVPVVTTGNSERFSQIGLPSDSAVVSPTASMIYTLVCKKGVKSTVPQSKTLKVMILNIKEQ